MASFTRYKEEEYFLNPDTMLPEPFPSLADPPTIDLSVIVPSYNEEFRLPAMLEEALEHLDERAHMDPDFTYEIIVVDDGSSDRTTQVGLLYSEKYGTENLRVLKLKKNRGKGGAVRLGFLVARGRRVMFADADGATQFSDLTRLEEGMANTTIADDNCAIVIGSRSHLQEEAVATRSFFRNILMYGFHFLVWLLTVRTVRDTQCGFKLFTREAARRLFSNLHVEGWAFDVELLYLAERLGISITEVPVNWHEVEGSKIVPVFTWLQMALDLVHIWLFYFLGLWRVAKPTPASVDGGGDKKEL